MKHETAIEAARAGKRLELVYDGYTRVVEVHAVGVTTAGNQAMRVWQIRGGSRSNEMPGWKMLRFDEARTVSIIDEKSEAPCQGYKRGDKGMQRILFEI